MNNTNRFLNRTLVFVFGLVLLLAGLAVGAGALVGDVQSQVSSAATDAVMPVSDALSGGQAWTLWVTAAVALLLIVLLLVFIFRQGRGHTSALVRIDSPRGADAATSGALTIDATVAQQVLEEALSRDPAILSVDVTAFEIRRSNVLRITACPRRGASPVAVRKSIDGAISEWDALLGADTPVVIQIVSGLRSQLSGTARVA